MSILKEIILRVVTTACVVGLISFVGIEGIHFLIASMHFSTLDLIIACVCALMIMQVLSALLLAVHFIATATRNWQTIRPYARGCLFMLLCTITALLVNGSLFGWVQAVATYAAMVVDCTDFGNPQKCRVPGGQLAFVLGSGFLVFSTSMAWVMILNFLDDRIRSGYMRQTDADCEIRP